MTNILLSTVFGLMPDILWRIENHLNGHILISYMRKEINLIMYISVCRTVFGTKTNMYKFVPYSAEYGTTV